MVKTCKCCGNTFEAETTRHRICPDCKEKHRKEHTKYIINYRKENRHQILITNDDYKVLKAISEVTKMSITETIHAIIQQRVLKSS